MALSPPVHMSRLNTATTFQSNDDADQKPVKVNILFIASFSGEVGKNKQTKKQVNKTTQERSAGVFDSRSTDTISTEHYDS